jgi:predicted DNA-binding transcriptional regulator
MSAPPRTIAVRSLLRRLGLEEREVDVYLALLGLKSARASAIAKAARQSRSHTYLVLRALKEKGLVSEIEKGKVLHFAAESPRRLATYLDDRADELRQLKPLVTGALPYLESLTGPLVGKPRVTMLQGFDGMKQVYRDLLPHEFCALFNPEAMYRIFGQNIVSLLFGKDAPLRGRDLLVRNAAAKRFVDEVPQGGNYTIRLLPEDVRFQTDTIVAGDTVAFFTYDDESSIVRIESRALADSVRAWFEPLWAQSEKTVGAFREPIV